MDSIYLLPGEERCVNFRDSDGIPKVHYTYCSLHGRLCTADFSTAPAAQKTKRSGYVRIGSSRRTAAI